MGEINDGVTADHAEGSAAPIGDDESRTAMRAFLQRSEVRLSTLHRVAQALLGGSALVLLLPLFLRDAFPKMMTVVLASYDARQSWVTNVALGASAALVILLPLPAIFLLVADLLGFYFTSNTFGAHAAGTPGPNRVVFNPRFIVPGLGFNNDELSPRTRQLLDEGRDDEWTRALLVPRTENDGGWRESFDTRSFEIWGTIIEEGQAGDAERQRQIYRMAGINRDRTLAFDVARTEALLARHVLGIRTVVLRYAKALLLVISTTVATLAASGLVDQAIREDPSNGKFVSGFPPRIAFLVAMVYLLWAPFAARSVTAPLRMIHRHTPGVGEHSDIYLDKRSTQFEAATVLVTFVVLIASAVAMLTAGYASRGGVGVAAGACIVGASVAAWAFALRDFRATPRDSYRALRLLSRGKMAPSPSGAMRLARMAARESEV
jgi:hypothetical protein